jgi:hypothetical protein
MAVDGGAPPRANFLGAPILQRYPKKEGELSSPGSKMSLVVGQT